MPKICTESWFWHLLSPQGKNLRPLSMSLPQYQTLWEFYPTAADPDYLQYVNGNTTVTMHAIRDKKYDIPLAAWMKVQIQVS